MPWAPGKRTWEGLQGIRFKPKSTQRLHTSNLPQVMFYSPDHTNSLFLGHVHLPTAGCCERTRSPWSTPSLCMHYNNEWPPFTFTFNLEASIHHKKFSLPTAHYCMHLDVRTLQISMITSLARTPECLHHNSSFYLTETKVGLTNLITFI